jgi:hypothetical protein
MRRLFEIGSGDEMAGIGANALPGLILFIIAHYCN